MYNPLSNKLQYVNYMVDARLSTASANKELYMKTLTDESPKTCCLIGPYFTVKRENAPSV